MKTEVVLTVATVVSMVIIAVLKTAGEWMILKKAGEKGWKALIPFYGDYVVFRIFWTGKRFFNYLSLVCLVSVANELAGDVKTGSEVAFAVVSLVASIALLVLFVKLSRKIAKAFGHGVGFTVGMVLLEPVFIMILGFCKSQYEAA